MIFKLISSAKKGIICLLIPCVLLTIYSCQKESISSDNIAEIIESNVVHEFTHEELMHMQQELRNAGYEIPEVAQTRDIGALSVKAIKVTTKTINPNNPNGEIIDISGILLVPKKLIASKVKDVSFIVNALPTYTYNAEAPSVVFDNYSLSSSIGSVYLVWTTLTALKDVAVFIPDYPGFGDSFGKCFTPYVTQEPVVRTTIELAHAAKQVMVENKYNPVGDITMVGYSQGGFVATAVARELDLNKKEGFKVDLLLSGGTPADLKTLTDVAREQEEVPYPFLLPYALCGFSHNGYTEIKSSDILLSPFDETSSSYFDGTYSISALNDIFPHEVSKLFTSEFIYGLDELSDLVYINEILKENSISPWKNSFPMRMFHSPDDDIVYEQCVSGFVKAQQQLGGQISLESLSGGHVSAATEFYQKVLSILL